MMRHCCDMAHVRQQRLRWNKALGAWDVLQIVFLAGVRNEVISDHQVSVGSSRIAEVAQDLKTVLVGPVVHNVAQEED